MRVFFDTSVLVAAVKAEHPRHEVSLRLLNEAVRRDSATAAHCLAELYATITGYPGSHRVSPADAKVILAGCREVLSIITLDERHYYSALDQAVAFTLMGGVIYDALIAQCALKWKAQRLYTWNLRDYVRLGSSVAPIVREPA